MLRKLSVGSLVLGAALLAPPLHAQDYTALKGEWHAIAKMRGWDREVGFSVLIDAPDPKFTSSTRIGVAFFLAPLNCAVDVHYGLYDGRAHHLITAALTQQVIRDLKVTGCPDGGSGSIVFAVDEASGSGSKVPKGRLRLGNTEWDILSVVKRRP